MKIRGLLLVLCFSLAAFAATPTITVNHSTGSMFGWDSANSTWRGFQLDALGRIPGLFATPAAAAINITVAHPLGSMFGWDDTNDKWIGFQLDTTGRVLLATQETLAVGTLELTLQAAAPATASEGWVYYDSTAHDAYLYTSLGWESLVSATTTSVSITTLEVMSATTLNQNGLAVGDFRWESDHNQYGIFGDASLDGVTIGGLHRSHASLEVNGGLWITAETTLNGSGGSNDTTILSANNNSFIHVDASADALGVGAAANAAYTMEVTGPTHIGGHFFLDGIFTQDAGDATFNEAGGNFDLRIESQLGEYLAFFDGGTHRVALGHNNPLKFFDVSGEVLFRHTTEIMTAIECDTYDYLNILRVATAAADQGVHVNIRTYGTGYTAADGACISVEDNESLNLINYENTDLSLHQNGLVKFTIGAAETVHNESGGDQNVRLESDNNANFAVLDAGADCLGVGGAPSGSYTLEVTGNSFFSSTLTANARLVGNDSGAGVDSWIESDHEADMFYIDASADNVGIGTSTPSYTLEVNGSAGINSTLYVTGKATLANNLFVDGTAEIDDTFEVTAKSFLDATQIDGNMSAADGTIESASNVAITGTVQAGTAVVQTIQDDGDSNVDVNDSLTVAGTVTANAIKNAYTFYAHDTTGGVAVPTTSYLDIFWDSPVITSGYTFTATKQTIEIDVAGTYEINYQIPVIAGTTETRASFRTRLYNITDVAEEAESVSYGQLRAPSGEVTIQGTFIEGFAANDQVKVQICRHYGDLSNAATLPGARIIIRRIE